MLKSKHFLCQRPVTEPCWSSTRRVDFSRRFEGGSGFVRLLPDARVSAAPAVGASGNGRALTFLLLPHSWSGEAPLLPALISGFALDPVLFSFEEALDPKRVQLSLCS